VRSLLDRGAAVDVRDADGPSALVASAYGNHVEVARLPVDADVDVNVKNNSEQSPYLIATSREGKDRACGGTK
jgi:hypothetical protein